MLYKGIVFIALICISNLSFALDTKSYQEEYIFLTNQLNALKARKVKTTKQLQDLEFKLKKEVENLGTGLAQIESKNEVLKTKLSSFDENRSDEERAVKKVDIVKSQMTEFVGKFEEKPVEDLELLNGKILAYLEKGAGESSAQGVAYNSQGLKEEGEIYTLGHVASYFVKGDDYIPLATNASKTGMVFTEAKVSKNTLENLSGKLRAFPVSLKEGELVKTKTFGKILREKLEAGGMVGYVIILLGFVGLFVAGLRYSLIGAYTNFSEEEVRDLVGRIQGGNIDGAKRLLYEQRSNPVNQFIDLLLSCRHKTDEVYEAIVVGEISKVQSRVSKYGPYLLVLAAVAPLLGLLGTVTGMIGTFDMITIHGTGNPKVLSGGIKEALVTTQMGLVVAIPCILVGNYLSSKALKVVSKFEEVASIIPKG